MNPNYPNSPAKLSTASDQQPRKQSLKTLHVTVPYNAWEKARLASLRSRLPFKDYIARLLLTAEPWEPDRPVDLPSGDEDQ